MPTPSQLRAVQRHASGATNDDFVVHEVVELVDEGEEGFGQEDLLLSSDQQQQEAVARRDAEARTGVSSSSAAAAAAAAAASSPSQPKRVITQSTFDAVVRENIDELEMEEEEAIAEACAQFQMQGVSLDGIATGLRR